VPGRWVEDDEAEEGVNRQFYRLPTTDVGVLNETIELKGKEFQALKG
jgi:hypothetical protein